MANFYRIGAGGLNWKNTGSWSGTSGGASNGVNEPSSSDAVIFDGNSPSTVTVAAAASGASLSLNKASLVITLNGGSITISGSTTLVGNSPTINKTASETFSTAGLTANTSLSGTAKCILTGGTWSGGSVIANNLDLQGTITISGTVLYGTGTMTYVSGTITASSATLSASSCTLNVNGVTWGNFSMRGVLSNITLTSDLQTSGTFTHLNGGVNATTSETITCNGFTNTNAGSGSARVIMTGGTWSATSFGYGYAVTLNGNITLASGTINYAGTSINYLSGTITTAGNTIQVNVDTTLDLNGTSLNNITFAKVAGSTIALTSALLVNSTITLSTGTAFSGTDGFTCATLSCPSTGTQTNSFKESVTYTITASLSCFASRVGSIVLFTSSHASTKAIITMPNNGANTCNVLASFTRIDASAGRSINTFGGTVTDCLNVNQFFDWKPIGAGAGGV